MTLMRYVCPLQLQEVRSGDPGRDDALRVRNGLEQLRLPAADVGDLQDGGDVAATVAVVGRAPHGHQLLVEHVLVPCDAGRDISNTRHFSAPCTTDPYLLVRVDALDR